MKFTTKEQNKFKKKIPKEIWELKNIFKDNGFTLYIVGGFIRDFVLNIDTDDIDICGSATPEQLESIIPKNEFELVLTNEKLGTYKIIKKSSKKCFEYTTLREEKYEKGHTPSEVRYILDIKKDVLRRDFTINAMYYDLINCELYDFYNGFEDCKERKLNLVSTHTFENDGLRIMRMLRFAYTKNLIIGKEVLNNAKWHMYLLNDISHAKIVDEMHIISNFQKNRKFCEEQKVNFSALDLVNNMINLHIIDKIFLVIGKHVIMDKFYEIFRVPKEFLKLLEKDINIGLVFVLCSLIERGGIEINESFILGLFRTKGLMFNKMKTVMEYSIITEGMLTFFRMADRNFYISYIQLYYPALNSIIEYIKLIVGENDEKLNRLIITNQFMQANNIPRQEKELAINGKDIIDKWPDIPLKYINSLIKCAMIIATESRCNEKEFLLEELKQFMESEKNDF